MTRKVRNRLAFSAAVLVLGLLAASHLEAQFRRGGYRSFSNALLARPEDYDGTFQFCRVVFNNGPDGDPMKCALARPHAVVLHRGALYVSDSENHCIRVVQ